MPEPVPEPEFPPDETRTIGQGAAPSRPEASPGVLPRRFGRFELLAELGRGGMGVVYFARQDGLDRPVALKLITQGLFSEPAQVERFQREARLAASLSHPGIVKVFETGNCEGFDYYTMEFIQGEPLDRLLRDGGIGLRQALAVVRGLALALHHAHGRGVLHRDLKPSNVILRSDDGQAVLTDFGLARPVDLGEGPRLTRTDTALGTPSYMAPEQAVGDAQAVGPWTDVYGLGALLYELLSGRPPFIGANVPAVLAKVFMEDPVPPSRLNADVDRDVETICLACLEKVPSRRYPSALALAEDIESWLEGRTIRARPAGVLRRAWKHARRHAAAVAVAAAALVLLAALTAFFMTRLLRERDRALAGEKLSRELVQGLEAAIAARDRAEAERLRQDEAVRLLEKARRGFEEAEAWFRRPVAERAVMEQRLLAAMEAIEKALLQSPALAQAHQLRGMVLRLDGRRAEAEAAFREAVRLAPDFGPAWYELGRLLVERAFLESMGTAGTLAGKRIGAGETAAEAVQALQAALTAGVSLEAPVAREVAAAMEAWLGLDWVRAQELCVAGIRKHGLEQGVDDLAWMAGLAAISLRKPDEAEFYFGAALQLRPMHSLACVSRAIARQDQGKLAEALADYGLAIQAEPRLMIAWSNRGAVRAIIGGSPSAAAQVRAAAGKWTEDPVGPAASLRDFERALELDPGFTPARVNRSGTLNKLGRHEDARLEASEAIRLDPAGAVAWRNRADARAALGDAAGALEDYAESIRLDPSESAAWLNRGLLRQRRGELDGALEDYEGAVRADPREYSARVNRGILRYTQQGDAAGALADLDEAVRLQARDPACWANRGTLRQATGDIAGAVSDWRKALEVAPPDWPTRPLVEENLRRAEGR